MRLTERMHFVPVFEADNIGTGVTGKSINMTNYHHAVFIILFSTLSGDAELTIKSGASDGTQTTAVTFYYRVSSEDFLVAGSDILSAELSSSSLTLTEATYKDKILVCEVDADDMTDGEEWLTLALDSSASAGSGTCVALLEPRYASKTFKTAL